MIPDDTSSDEILTLLKSQVMRERLLALRLIGKHRIYRHTEACILCLSDTEHEVREYAAWALDQLSSPEAVPALLQALHDSHFGVRSNAGWALVHIARRTIPNIVVPEVIDILQGEDENAQQMAYLVLHYIGGETARAAIRKYWNK